MEQTSVDLCLLLAPLHDGHWKHLAYVHMASRFSGEVMVKGYQAIKDSWATVLGKEMLARGKLTTGLIFS